MFRERIAKKTGSGPISDLINTSSRGMSGSLNARQILWLTVTGLAVGILVSGAFLPPFVDESVRSLVMAGYRQVCHQIPGRSFHFAGEQIALCHRCVGIWGALPVAIAVFAMLRRWDRFVADRAGLVIVASLVPLGVDWAGDFLGLWSNTAASRVITGSVFGIVAGYFLARVVVKSVKAKPRDSDDSPRANTQVH